MAAGALVVMGIGQLPSGSFQVHFQLDGVSLTAAYPTHEMTEEAELLMRAAALARRHRRRVRRLQCARGQ